MNHPRATQTQPPDTWYDGNRGRIGPREPQGNWDRTGSREPSAFRNIPMSPPPFRNEPHHAENAHPEMFTTAPPSMSMFMTEQTAPSWQYQGTPSTAKNTAAHATDGMDSQGFSTAVPSHSQSTQDDLEFVKAHPVGALFLSILADNTLSAKKNGTKQTHLNVGQISAALKSLEKHEEQKVEKSLEKKTAKIEHNLIARDLNATKVSLDNPPPAMFASEDKLVTLHAKKDAQLTFPFRHNKFSGNNPKENGCMSVSEYLNHLCRAQASCMVSRREFQDIMLATTTGRAHSLLVDWFRASESIESTFHLLSLNFDRRISINEAKIRLQNYKCPKTDSLAKCESYILSLATRASDIMPSPESKLAYLNMEACMALLRALPPQSAVTAMNLFHSLCSKKGDTLTYSEFTSHLNLYADSINAEIKAQGVEGPFTGKKNGNQKQNNRGAFNKSNASNKGQAPTQFANYGVHMQHVPFEHQRQDQFSNYAVNAQHSNNHFQQRNRQENRATSRRKRQ
jgi:hypothetical protein